MGLFSKFKKENAKEKKANVEAEQVTPQFFGKPDGSVYATITLKEGTATVLPRDPWALWKSNGQSIDEWQLCLVGTSVPGIIKDLDYRAAFTKLIDYRLDESDYNITVRPLTYEEMEFL